MSGTSADGLDGVVVDWSAAPQLRLLASAHHPFSEALQHDIVALNAPGENELHRAAVVADAQARIAATVVQSLLTSSQLPSAAVAAIGFHGQTVRHCPPPTASPAYTVQIHHASLLAELTGIDVVCDFRARDVAAGGHGAPLVPAFHAEVFQSADRSVAVLNLGGIANWTLLPAQADGGPIGGFDCGPANALMDEWCRRHRGHPFDVDGQWAGSGTEDPTLLARLLSDPYFDRAPPKSTGRDYFHAGWLAQHGVDDLHPADVQATLAALTAESAANALRASLPHATQVWVCGGGALNGYLMRRLERALRAGGFAGRMGVTGERGLPPLQVEACAFAWLAQAFLRSVAGNVPTVTGALGPRRLGMWVPAR